MTTVHARFADRAADVRARRRYRRLRWMAAVMVVLALVWVVGFSSVLSVRTVRAEGGSATLQQQVRGIGAQALGQPLVRVSTAALTAQISGLPEVQRVEVTRSFPATVVVRLTPRVPVMVVRGSDGAAWLVDSTGRPYAKATTAHDGLPQIELRTSVTTSGALGLRTLVTVIDAVPQARRDQLSDVRLDGRGRVSFRLGSLAVQWGDAEGSARKGQVLQTMLPIATADRASSLDLSAPDRPVITGASNPSRSR